MTGPSPEDLPPPTGRPAPVDDPASAGAPDPATDPAPPVDSGSGLAGLFELAVTVVTSPGRGLDEVVRRTPVAWSIVVVLTVNALTAVTQVASASGSISAGSSMAPLGAGASFSPSGTFVLVGGVLGGASFGLAAIAVWTAIVLLFARMLGGTGGYRATFCGLAFASVPQILTVVVSAVSLPLGVLGTVLGLLAAVGVAVWTLVLSVMAVQRAHAMSTGRAVAAVLLPMVAIALLFAIGVALVIALLVSAFS